MKAPRSRHHNNCLRCPVIGAESTSEDEVYKLLSLRFNIRIARELSRGHEQTVVDPQGLARWIENSHIDRAHIDHIPVDAGAGIMVTLPSGCGKPLIDGNHRAARALRDDKPFAVVVLSETETLSLLCNTMGIYRADVSWQRMLHSKPHPLDKES